MNRLITVLMFGGLLLFSGITEAVQTIKAGNIANIEISVSTGNVTITPWSKDEIQVEADESDYEMTTNSSGVLIDAEDVGEIAIKLPVRLNIDISTSAGAVLMNGDFNGKISIRTSAGDIDIGNANGAVSLKTSGGNITTKDLRSNALLESSGGNIATGAISGALEVHTAGGDMDFGNVARDLNASSGGGNITAGNVGGFAKLATSGGEVFLGNVGGSVQIMTGGGNIEVNRIGGDSTFTTGGGDVIVHVGKGSMKIKTGGGDVIIENVNGSLEAVTGGGDIEAHIEPDPAKPSSMSSGGGDIALYIPFGTKATIDAVVTVKGRWSVMYDSFDISSDFEPATYDKLSEKQQIHATYKLNGGGTAIQLATTNGDIFIGKK